MFPPKSGALVTNRFTSAGAGAVDALPERESQVLAEVSNIIINAVTDSMAAACGEVLMLSSPKPPWRPGWRPAGRPEFAPAASSEFKRPGTAWP
jgi:chemotaxis protein CheY-P-specific phosphatase CheC